MSLSLLCCLWVSAAHPFVESSATPTDVPAEQVGGGINKTAAVPADYSLTRGSADTLRGLSTDLLLPSKFRLIKFGASANPHSSFVSVASADGARPSTVNPLRAGTNLATEPTAYTPKEFVRQTKSIPWRLGGAAVAITATGLANWNWGSSSFRFKSEGWFGKDTASLGIDKVGHAYSSYVLTEFFTDGIIKTYHSSPSSSYTAALLATGLMTYIEVFDGFSKEHGFSHEDLIVDAAGALFSVVRRSVPGAREKVDFRLLYTPSRSTLRALSCFPSPHCKKGGETARSPLTDYVNQRYFLALKFSGFKKVRQTPLRFLELHGGYYASGFTREEEERGKPLRRRLFVGAGLNVSELMFGRRRGRLARAGKSLLEFLQPPYAAVHSN